MNFYKRVFLKWIYDLYVLELVFWVKSGIFLVLFEVDME